MTFTRKHIFADSRPFTRPFNPAFTGLAKHTTSAKLCLYDLWRVQIQKPNYPDVRSVCLGKVLTWPGQHSAGYVNRPTGTQTDTGVTITQVRCTICVSSDHLTLGSNEVLKHDCRTEAIELSRHIKMNNPALRTCALCRLHTRMRRVLNSPIF